MHTMLLFGFHYFTPPIYVISDMVSYFGPICKDGITGYHVVARYRYFSYAYKSPGKKPKTFYSKKRISELKQTFEQ